MYVVEKPKFLDILKLIPNQGCTKADLYKNTYRSKDYVTLALRYWESEQVILLTRKSKDARFLWVQFTIKGLDVKRVYDILSAIMDLKTKDFRGSEE